MALAHPVAGVTNGKAQGFSVVQGVTEMNINGQFINRLREQTTTYYHLASICKALNLNLDASITYLDTEEATHTLMAGGEPWITEAALMHWMVMPNQGRIMSPEALCFAQQCAKKTLQALERAGWQCL